MCVIILAPGNSDDDSTACCHEKSRWCPWNLLRYYLPQEAMVIFSMHAWGPQCRPYFVKYPYCHQIHDWCWWSIPPEICALACNYFDVNDPSWHWRNGLCAWSFLPSESMLISLIYLAINTMESIQCQSFSSATYVGTGAGSACVSYLVGGSLPESPKGSC